MFGKGFSKKEKAKIAFLISGRGSNMKAILKKIAEKKLNADPVLVFSDKPDAQGLEIAKSFGVKTASFTPKSMGSKEAYEEKIVELLKSAGAEWIVCAGYMRILNQTILTAYKNKIINVHPSLLPAFPGLKAQRQAVEYGVRYSGCTVHFVDDGVDTGPIIAQRVVAVEAGDTEESLSRKILKEEHDLYWRAIQIVVNGFCIDGRRVEFTK